MRHEKYYQLLHKQEQFIKRENGKGNPQISMELSI
jgi:hypothetical protein